MPSTDELPPVCREAESVEFVWKQIRAVLEKERHRIYDEIKSYPTPIPACDEQFNDLLEQRDRVSRELDRAKAAAVAQRSLAACRTFLDGLASPKSNGDEAEQKLRRHVRDGVA